jgi:cytochrome c-type biogenesis protein
MEFLIMLDEVFYKINEMIIQTDYLAYVASFLWGVISVIFSPCHLASIPLLIAYISGFTENKKIKNSFYYSLLFSIGLFISISAIGFITSALGRMFGDIGNIWNYIVGIILIIVALHLFGFVPINISGLHKIQTKKKGEVGAFLLGLTYGIVSGPCTFGFIMPMLAFVAIQETYLRGITLIIIFSLGHCIPILIGGCTTTFVKNITGSGNIQKSGIIFKKIAGIIFLLVALYIMFN